MDNLVIQKKAETDVVIALVGNPNVGKSTVFNALTGLNQHTGNWSGKTVSIAQGRYTYKGKGYILVDLPGTYSLMAQSEEERIAVDFIRSGQADCTLVVGDATCLERSLNLALQVMDLTDRMIFCVNLLDEADRRDISLDLRMLECRLGIPVIGTSAGTGDGLSRLTEKLRNLVDGFAVCEPRRISGSSATDYVRCSREIASAVVTRNNNTHSERMDRIVLGKWTGSLLLLLFLFGIFWLTIQGANYPSRLLKLCFDYLDVWLRKISQPLPMWLQSMLLDGIYATVAQVISVMLPPMTIFFPLFTFLEDLGYLPRIAFLMDRSFQRCGGCGKQALTMSMGFGCNAVGVMGCRIISSPRERLIAVLTNAMVPCNGRFPAMITLITLFFSDHAFMVAILLTLFVLLSVGMTLGASAVLNKTVLRNDEEALFVLELPPYRRPQIGKIFVRSVLDRTVFVLGRAVCVAAPAGLVIWILQRITVDGLSALQYAAALLDPIGCFLGMNGAVMLAFLLSFPANELLLPATMMIMRGGFLEEASLNTISSTFASSGWDWQTALCVILFLQFHWPCGTTCLTIRRETASGLWTAVSIAVPTLIGIILCRIAAVVI